MERQHTIAEPVTLRGRGLFLARDAEVTFRPAPANHGVVFRRLDLGGAEVPALVQHVVRRDRRTAIQVGEASVDTCEHCLSAVAGHRIDNLLIDLTGPEVPLMDGSALPFYERLGEAGLTPLDAERERLVVPRAGGGAGRGDEVLAAMPADEPEMQIVYELDYSRTCPVIGRQMQVFDFRNGNYADQVAPSRTFTTEEEARLAREAGMFEHLSPDSVLVVGADGPLGNNSFRFSDEPVRHKLLDLIGDLYLLGAPIQGRIIAYKSGHPLNHQLVRKLIEQHRAQRLRGLASSNTVVDIRRLFRMMPHRYPMLLVDRVVELDGDRRAVGIKNVTINEPFFQGHYPKTPIMPGVLVVEAMAQLSGGVDRSVAGAGGEAAGAVVAGPGEAASRGDAGRPVDSGGRVGAGAEPDRPHAVSGVCER